MSKKINDTFTGTVDQFLDHCSKLDFDISEEEIKEREYEQCIKYIMELHSLSREEAIELYNEMALENVKDTINRLVDEGLVEIHDYDETGEPRFVLTELGKKCAEEITSQIESEEKKASSKKKKKSKKKK